MKFKFLNKIKDAKEGRGASKKMLLQKLTCDIVFILAEILGLCLGPKTAMLMAYDLPNNLQQENQRRNVNLQIYTHAYANFSLPA